MALKSLQLISFLWVLAFLGHAWAQSQQDEARYWLERMIEAVQTLNYEGTFVYVQGPHLETMHIVHSGGPEKRQILSSLTGSMRQVLVENNRVTCLLPNQKTVYDTVHQRRTPFPPSLPRELSKLEDYYSFELDGQDRVAGKETQIVAIKPRDEKRFGYRLWLENASAMPLRSALVDNSGHFLEQMMFTNWQQVDSEPDPVLFPDLPNIVSKLLQESPTPQTAQNSEWAVTDPPRGFTQVTHSRLTPAPASAHPTEHIVFTDGLATVSVFIEPLAKATQPALEGPSEMGAMNAFGKVIADHQIVVVGEVPIATVKMIAESVQHIRRVANP